MSEQTTCGDAGGTTKSGEPCGQPVTEGRCYRHRDQADDEDGCKLTDKQRRFVEEYCASLNATQAAIDAGYSEKTAHSIGHENLRKPEIDAAIQARMEQEGMTAAEATRRMGDLARANLLDFTRVTNDGRRVIDLTGARAEAMMHVIKKMKVTNKRMGEKGEVFWQKTEIELHDAKDAIYKILQAHGVYTERVDITTGGDKLQGPTIYLPDNNRVGGDDE